MGKGEKSVGLAIGVLVQNFNDREIVELTASIAAYNPVSRFLEALQIDPEK